MKKNVIKTASGEQEQQPLPPDFFPNCWSDDERMDNLFAPFRAKSVNPVNYDRKLEFWRNLIGKYCVNNGNAIVTVNELRNAFQRGEKKPYCLDVVLKELTNAGSVRPRSLFAMKPQETWSVWAMNTFIKSPLQWSFNKVKERVVSVADATIDFLDTEFVVLDVVEDHAKRILEYFNETNEPQSVLIEQDLCVQMTEKLALKLDGVKIALHVLCNTGRASFRDITIDNKTVRLYKLTSVQNPIADELTKLDVSLFTLRRMEKSLIKSVEGIETDIKNTDTVVRGYLKEQKKQLAKSFLRKKHVLGKNLDKTANALSTLQLLLMQIDETKHNAQLVEALKLGSTTLKSALEEKNITIDSVEDTLSDVKDILDLNEEIQFALSGAQFNDIIGDGFDDAALEDELKDLLEDNSPTADRTDIEPKLPSPPRNDAQPHIANVIDDLLEERLKNLGIDSRSINVTIQNNSKDLKSVAHAN